MSITAFIGRQGSGKTLEMTWIGLHLALKYGKRFACNYALDLDYLAYFARAIASRNLFLMIKSGDIICSPGSIDYLLAIPDAVVCIDEIAIYLGDSVESPQRVKYLISRFNQCRRRGIELLYVAHSLQRVQKFLRDVTNNVCYCDGKVTRTDNGDIHLKSEKYCYFDLESFENWFASPKRLKFLFLVNGLLVLVLFMYILLVLAVLKETFFKAFDSFSDITNDANSSFLLRYQKLSFPGAVIKPAQPVTLPEKTVQFKIPKKPSLLLIILLFLREILKKILSVLILPNSDYLKAYEYVNSKKSRRPWTYTSPIDSKLCKVVPRDGLTVFISTLDVDYGTRLTADSVFRVWFYWRLPAGLESMADSLAVVLGYRWTLPTNSILLKYKKPAKT